MREIKFRAWDEESKRMFNIARFDFADHTVYSHLFACEGYLAENLKIMQYTGLTDKNGCEIYEGDVVESFTIPNGYICRGVVIFENGSFLMDVKNAPFAESGFKADFDERICEYTVLGNIYENPELLEVEK